MMMMMMMMMRMEVIIIVSDDNNSNNVHIPTAKKFITLLVKTTKVDDWVFAC
jgi:hypothetical protein